MDGNSSLPTVTVPGLLMAPRTLYPQGVPVGARTPLSPVQEAWGSTACPAGPFPLGLLGGS